MFNSIFSTLESRLHGATLIRAVHVVHDSDIYKSHEVKIELPEFCSVFHYVYFGHYKKNTLLSCESERRKELLCQVLGSILISRGFSCCHLSAFIEGEVDEVTFELLDASA